MGLDTVASPGTCSLPVRKGRAAGVSGPKRATKEEKTN
jgi:hypothetical protein